MGSGNVKKFELKLGKTGIVITVTGMALLICVSFVLGVTVGKNIDTYPAKISSGPQKVLAFFWRPAKVSAMQNQEEAASDKKNKKDKSNMDLTFHQNLTQSKTPSFQPPPAGGKKKEVDAAVESEVPAPVAATPESTEHQAQNQTENKPLPKKTADGKTKTASKADKEDKKEAPAKQAETGAPFMIHVASMKEKSKADQIQKSIAEVGYKAKIVQVDIKGKGIWYRVIVSGFESKAQAKAAVDKISRKIKTNCIIRAAGSDTDKKP